MNNKIKSEKYRVLSVAALVTCILVYGLGGRPLILSQLVLPILYPIFFPVALGLSITAVVCGSFDLKRIKAGRYSNKGRGFDIAGIVLGGIPILSYFVVLSLELIAPH